MSEGAKGSARLAAANAVGAVWWYFLIRGLFLLAAGIYMLLKPAQSLIAIAQVIALLLILDGVLAFAAVFAGQAQSRLWSVVRGTLLLAAGLFVLLQPALVSSVAIKTVIFIVAPLVILCGVFEISGSLKSEGRDTEGKGSWFGGLLTVFFGTLLILAPIFFGELIVSVMGGIAILMAVPLLLLAFKFRKLKNRIAEAA